MKQKSEFSIIGRTLATVTGFDRVNAGMAIALSILEQKPMFYLLKYGWFLSLTETKQT